jgi:protein gp37
MASTEIEWATDVWNFVRGCRRISPGCGKTHEGGCYAERQAIRQSGPGGAYEGLVQSTPNGPRWTGAGRFVPEKLAEPLSWRKRKDGSRRRCFVNSMSDLFFEEFSNEQIAAGFGVMAACPDVDFLILTKRAERMRDILTDPSFAIAVEDFRVIAAAGRIAEFFAPERTVDIEGWPGYFVTSKGRVLSDRSKSGERAQERHELKPMAGEAGHARVMLYRGGETERLLVHRLVLDAFDRRGTFDEQGCHLNGDASINALWNLRWGSQSENWDDSKRHGTRRRYHKLTAEQVTELRARAEKGESGAALGRAFGISDTQARNIISGKQWTPEHAPVWPLPNCWLGVSAEDQQRADERIPHLLATPAAVRFVSAEPLIAPLDLRAYMHDSTCPLGEGGAKYGQGAREICLCTEPREVGIDWCILGGESGPSARPCDLEWIRSLVKQCREAGVAAFVKQLGKTCVEDMPLDPYPDGRPRFGRSPLKLKHSKGGDIEEWPERVRVRQFPTVRP